MYSVTQRVQAVKQPYGGYLPVKNFEVIQLNASNELKEGETISPVLIGLAVDYLTRVMSGTPSKEAFKVSLAGASIVGESNIADKLVKTVKGIDDESIIAACKLVGYDSAFRAGVLAYKDVNTIIPTEIDIYNIHEMVERSVKFFGEYGPVTSDGITFEGGYTFTVSSGDGDFLTKDSLWDFKVSVKKPTSKHTLQLLMYYIMGLHSIHSDDYKVLKYLAIFNPRLNAIYRYPISNIPEATINEVSEEVICYSDNDKKQDDEDIVLSVKDVAARYGISENKVRKDCFSLGLPHRKQGNKYVIDELELIEWEVRQVYITVGRNGRKLLPGYCALIGLLTQELNEAKQNGDKNRVKELKKELKRQKNRNPDDHNYVGIIIVACIVSVIVLSIAIPMFIDMFTK